MRLNAWGVQKLNAQLWKKNNQKHDFIYMKFIYLHCGEETNLRAPRSQEHY